MNKVARFEKVSYEQFKEDWLNQFPNTVEWKLKSMYENIKLPKRSTTGSAGYDFYIPRDMELREFNSIVIPTGIRCVMDYSYVLAIFPRSGQGFKYGVHLANTVGIIDADYCNAENEGHIHVKLVNDSRLAKDIDFNDGVAFCQGIFLPFGITVDDEVEAKRIGGFGSTDSK